MSGRAIAGPLTFACIEAGHGGLTLSVAAAGAAALALLGGFLAIEHSRIDPMLPLGSLRRPSFSAANAVAATMNLGTLGLFFPLTLYLQTVQHRSALAAGIAVLPLFLPLSLLAPIAGRLTARVGPRLPMAAGLLIAAPGVALLARSWPRCCPGASAWVCSPRAVVAAAVGAVEVGRAGLASGINNTARQAGGAIGIAAFGGLAGPATRPAGFIAGLHTCGLVTAGSFLAAALATLLLIGERVRGHSGLIAGRIRPFRQVPALPCDTQSMEAATPLRAPHVRVIGNRVAIDGLVVEDDCAVRLVQEREQNGEDPAKIVRDAVEIGARVLDREQAGANAEFVKTEFERAATQLNSEFTDRARAVAEYFNEQVDKVFGPENGQLAKDLETLFSDGSSVSVQNRVRELVAETMTRSREDLMRQFSAADGSNPLADFKAGTIRVLKAAEERQYESQHALLRQMGELEKQMQALRLEKEKLEEVEAERERGTAKGRTFEEQVADAVDRIALAQGDVAEAVGDRREATGKVGDVVVAIDACNGPARGRIVIEAKDRRLSRPRAMSELDDAMAERSSDFALLIVPTEDELPAKVEPLREYNGDKLVVALDPGSGTLALELGYRLARARVLMKRSDGDGIDAGALRDTVERALAALAEERKVKQQLTGAKTSIDKAYELVEAMACQVRAQLGEIDVLVRPPEEEATAGAEYAPPLEPEPRRLDDQLAL